VVVHNLVLFARLNPHNPSQPGPDPNDPPPAAYNARSNRVPKTARLPDRPMPPPAALSRQPIHDPYFTEKSRFMDAH